MADYNPLGKSRADSTELYVRQIHANSNHTHSDTNWAEVELNVRDVMQELGDLLIKKHRDYGPKNISESPGGPLNGLRVRMHDKLARINNLIDNNRNPENESLEDSFKDMANYAIIGLLVLRGQWNND